MSVEPSPDPEVLVRVRRALVDRTVRAPAAGPAPAARTVVPGRQDVARLVREVAPPRGDRGTAVLTDAVHAAVAGAGALQALLDEPGVTDVLVAEAGSVWVDRGCGLERSPTDLGDEAQVRALAVRLAAAGGRRLDDASPVVDARLPDGTRLHAVLPPVAQDGTVMSLRVLRRQRLGLADLVASRMVDPALAPVLRALVAGRATVLVSGATGSGKTTLLASLLALVPADERIVCLEESAELAPHHPHVVRLVTREPNVEGAGAVDLVALVRAALRMRPDRIVLGECRGAEVREVLAAFNTGHDGGWATLHANAVQDVPARLAAMAALAGMDGAALAAQAAAALDAVVHLRRDKGRRWVAQVGAVELDEGRLAVQEVVAATLQGGARYGPGWQRFAERWGIG